MATQNGTHDPAVPVQIKAAGMAADLYGSADERPPLVLLHGLTFDRRIWRPVLAEPWTCPVTAIQRTSSHTLWNMWPTWSTSR
jgi:pimeloyl-ACP methyl ester carboxylesterase